jgi:hypothetical protein
LDTALAARLFDPAGQIVRQMEGSINPDSTLAFTADGTILAGGSG